MIIGLLGKKRVGKDTVADYLVKSHGFTKLSFADPLKRACQELFSWNDVQIYGNEEKEIVDKYWGITPRQSLQYVGTELIRNQMENLIPGIKDDFWVKCAMRIIDKNPNKNYVIADCRFINEVNAIHAAGGSIWKISRDGVTSDDSHASETGIDEITEYEDTIQNDGTILELYKKIDELLE